MGVDSHNRMNQEIRDQWVDALLSGKYQQGRDMLCNRQTGGFCCLGVLTDLAVQAGIGKWVEGIGYSDETEPVERSFEWVDDEGWNQVESGLLPRIVAKWAGLDVNNTSLFISDPVSFGGQECCDLTEVNDHGGTFEDIAKIIEEQY